MANRPFLRTSRLDSATAERLLSAAGPSGYPRLAELLAAAAAPDSSAPLPGAESAVAAYRRKIPGSNSAAGANAVRTGNAGRAR